MCGKLVAKFDDAKKCGETVWTHSEISDYVKFLNVSKKYAMNMLTRLGMSEKGKLKWRHIYVLVP